MGENRSLREVAVIGAGLFRYGVYPEIPFTDMGTQAVNNALKDAGVDWPDIELGYCAYTNLGIASGHTLARAIGANGITMTNLENASASGSAAFCEAYLAIASGLYDLTIAIGIDKLKTYRQPKSEKGKQFNPKSNSNTRAMQDFASIAREYMSDSGTTIDQLAMISVKNHFNGSLNPYAHFQKPVTLEEVKNAKMVAEPLTVLHCCPWDEGAAAVVLCAAESAHKYTTLPCPRILASASSGNIGGTPLVDLTRLTALRAYEKAGLGPEDLNLIELHDAAAIEEIMYYEALGLCQPGEGGKLIESGATAINGRIPVNTSGGLISMGHPIGPTGLGQIAEILWQIRGQAKQRQIAKIPKIGLAHMLGIGGVCFIHVLGL